MDEWKRYHIGDAHDGEGSALWGSNVPDYYPLTLDEIAALLSSAQQSADRREISSIELRLCQGIWGFTSLVSLHGSVEYARRHVVNLYRQGYQLGPSDDLVWELHHWMHATFER